MKHRRYGKFQFRDYWSLWPAIVILLAVIISGLLTKVSLYWLISPLVFLVIVVWSIIAPNRECFSLSGSMIQTIQGKRLQQIPIPENPVLVITHASICGSWGKRLGDPRWSFRQKGRYAVAILQNTTKADALRCLHKNHAQSYSLTSVELNADWNTFVYGFVYEPGLLRQLTENRHCQIIIPETLVHKVQMDLPLTGIFIDIGY